jgi:chemotaxis family two-component system response regulator Rcp1
MSVPTILVIEDNLADIYLLQSCLDERGEEYRLQIMVDGEAALRFVEECRRASVKPEPCVILLDLNLPKYNGAQILAAIRQEPVMDTIHVMVLTSFASPQQRAEVEMLGALCRIKPAGLGEFHQLVDDILALCRQSMSATAVRN